jgi:hypothetical protein
MPAQTRNSARILEREHIAQLEGKALQEQQRQKKRTAPRDCQQCRVYLARRGSKLCAKCHMTDRVAKAEQLVICQGCPCWIPTKTHDRIRWKQGDPLMARWLEKYLEIEEDRSSSYTAARWLQVTGWKGEKGTTDVPRMLDG